MPKKFLEGVRYCSPADVRIPLRDGNHRRRAATTNAAFAVMHKCIRKQLIGVRASSPQSWCAAAGEPETAASAAIMKQERRSMSRIFASLLVTAILSGSAPAGDADKAAQAESLEADGKYLEPAEAVDQAKTSLWDKSPLSFRRALWVVGKPMGFGVYNPRETKRVQSRR